MTARVVAAFVFCYYALGYFMFGVAVVLVFCFNFAARYLRACALADLPFPNPTTAQYLFQYMISFLLRSRYSFIFKGTKSLLICGYVPLCSLRRVLWVLFMLFGNGLLPALRAASCTPCVNKTPKFYFQNETSQLVPVVVESVSCLFLLSPFCLISLFRVVTCFQTVAVKSSYISVIDCNDFMMSTEFRLQWWVGGFVTHLRVACCTHPPTTATSHSLSPKWAGLTIPHLSVDKKGLRLFI